LTHTLFLYVFPSGCCILKLKTKKVTKTKTVKKWPVLHKTSKMSKDEVKKTLNGHVYKTAYELNKNSHNT